MYIGHKEVLEQLEKLYLQGDYTLFGDSGSDQLGDGGISLDEGEPNEGDTGELVVKQSGQEQKRKNGKLDIPLFCRSCVESVIACR